MNPIPINLPPGLYKNGTPYTRKDRWVDGNLVRHHDGAWRPVGGWSIRTDNAGADLSSLVLDPALEAVRDGIAWRSLSRNQQVVFGSNLKLYHLSEAGVVTDITPAGVSTSSKDSAVIAGYGQNVYGSNAFGSSIPLAATEPTPPRRWSFANFGEILLFLQRSVTSGPIWELDLGTLTASIVTNSPTGGQAIVVTDERQVFVVGADGEPRKVAFSDNEDRNTWAQAVSNQAGDFTIAGTGRLLNAVKVLRQILILGENDANVARYIGPPYIYSFELVGDNCGLIAAEAVANTDRFAVWWGERNFWLFDGSVRKLECDVIDFLYRDIDNNQIGKITAFTRADYSEISWLYQSGSSSGEIDSYVTWNYSKNVWYTGRLNRTAAIDKGTLLNPLMVDDSGVIYNHELNDVLPDGDVFITSGILNINNGAKNMAVRQIWPDNEDPSDTTYTLLARQFPNTTEYTYGPYAYNNPIPTRAMGREIRLRVDMSQSTSEVGIPRFDVAPIGTGQR